MSELGDISAPAPAPNPLDEFSTPVSSARQKAVVNSNASPDDAGRAVAISKQTGIPPTIVQTDLPGYDAHAKTQAAIKAVDNPAIANYVDKNPMASQVSNDDYEKLDEVSQYFQNLHRDQIHGKASVGVLAGIPEVANLLTSAPGRDKLYNALKDLPGALGKGILDFLKVPGDVSSGKINLQTPQGLEQGISFGLGIALGGRDIRVGREPGANVSPPGDVEDFLAKVRGAKTRQEIDDFIASKTEGPPSQMLMIEKARAGGEALDKAVEVSQDSKTKQRSPDLYEEFLQAHGDQGTVHVPAQAILDLYESQGKVPMVGDDLFGFVPGLADKATLAAETGAEIKIPVSKYVAHVDEAVHEKLKDVVRVQEDGVTREEAKALATEETKPATEIANTSDENPVVQAAVEKVAKEKESLYLNLLFTDASAINITEPEFKRYSDLIDRAQEHILTKAVALAKRDAAKRLTPEWKASETRIQGEVEKEITSSPAYLADRYFNFDKGMLPNGKRILSSHYKPLGEVLADEWAPIFGFESGAEMSRAIIARELAREESGKGPKWQLKQEVDAETARRMETEFGKLDENIALEASEAALAEYNVDLLATELRMLAKVNGREPPIGRAELATWVKGQFDRSVASDVSYEQWRRAAEKGGREAEKALLKKDYVEAFNAKQRQMLSFVLAREAKAFERERARTEGKIERFTKEQVIKSIDQEHLEQIRAMLDAVGVDQRYEPSRPLEPIDQFVANSEGQIAVAPWLRGELPEGMRSPPTVDTMSVEQYRDLGKSLQSMEHVGKAVKTISDARGAAELQNVVVDAKAELERFKFIDQPVNQSLVQKARSVGRTIIGAHLLVERMFDYTDKFNPEGPLNRYIDRPLRDSQTKEIQLTEQITKMLRDLYQYADKSDLEIIPNNLIPDKMSASGFMNMNRQNLRQLMLHTGNWSNFKKLSEGFGLNEADIRRFIDTNAIANDVAWVNGIWKIFDFLKPEADAMQLRDTGVPADTIPSVAWEIKAGKLNGGYHPLVYDKYNSDIQGHMAAKNPVFDPHYVQATTPHGYTVARTEFKGALDLTGHLLATRLQGMVHDIAFREAVRSANKLISNQEFRTALAQRWGKEYSDLLPGWLKDIANSHTLDDQYAQGIARTMALIRQNVISTLIAFNPSTVIKHGFTAMLMSAERVGAVDLAKATKDLGLNDAWQTAKDLVRRGESVVPNEDYMQAFRDALDQGERGDSIRNFVLQSSPVMRARSRQVDDTIRGAIDKMNQLGVKGLFMNLREKNIQYGRFAVAFSDQLSAVPTWYAAYKHAYLEGASHEDAVFQADKEVSRAHGSQFTGDQPRVTRIGNGFQGEVLKLFTPLYKFYNHFANGNFQFAWDANAYLKGNPTGEPGANAARLSLHIGIVLMTLFIEEQASAALDKDRKGFLHSMLMKSLHLFGGQFVGLREVTSGLSHGYGPASGLMGTIWKAGEETVKDIGKATGVKAGIAKNWIKHTADAVGFTLGLGGSQLGRTGQFLTNVATGRDRPQGFNQWRQGLRTGSSNPRVH